VFFQLRHHVLNAAARILSNIGKYDQGLSHFRRRELHWLDVVDRVCFRVCVQVYKCLHNMAPGYLSTLWQPVSSVPAIVTYARLVVVNWTFPVSIWLCTGDSLKNINLTLQTFKRYLKTFLFSTY